MRILMSLLIGCLLLTPSYATDIGASADTGQFHYRVTQIDLVQTPGNRLSVQALLGFEITNTGKVPVRIAIVPVWPAIQLEGAGLQLQLAWRGIIGVASFWSGSTANCTQGAADFTLLRPNSTVIGNLVLEGRLPDPDLPVAQRARFTASVMVQSLEDKQCWIEPFSVANVPVSIRH